MDEAIRANNLKMIELVKKKKQDLDQAASNQVQEKSTISIQEIKNHVKLMNDQDREELAKLLIQRCAARLEQRAYDLAKEDLSEALSMMHSSEEQSNGSHSSFCNNFYLAEYLLGMCCHGIGEYGEAAKHFQKSINHREYIEGQLVNCENSEKELKALEEEFFCMQLEAKRPIEKVAATWTRNWSYYSTNVTNFTNKAKNFYNHNLMLGSDKPVLNNKPNTIITLELLYIRAGVSYYNGTFYSDAIPYFNRAIEIGESYQSEFVESSCYNRGLCYYYLGELQMALADFSKSISLMPLLKQRDVVYMMRAATYGRLGMTKEKKSDENKAYIINPFVKPLPLFHLRLLNDDVLCHIMSFLQTKHWLVISSLDKYSRNLVKKYLQENEVHICRDSLITWDRKTTSSIGKSLFLPREERPIVREMIKTTLLHPMLVENAKNLLVYQCADYLSGYYEETNSMEVEVVTNYKNLQRLVIMDYSAIKELLPINSPDLEFLEIGVNSFDKDELSKLITELVNLRHLRLGIAFFSGNVFENCKKLQTVEYLPMDNDQRETCKSMYGFDPDSCLTWDNIKDLNPHITFKEYYGRSLYESSCYNY